MSLCFNLKTINCVFASIFVLQIALTVKSVAGICGYPSCPKSKAGYINVHLVPHSHDDVGWLKTVDQYYYGTNLEIDPGGVQYILDSVITELRKNPHRRFIYVETAFFWRWWRNQNDEIKEMVNKYVQNGQLEFISGGWSLNDEGCTHYSALIDQMSLGMRFLNDTFGECAIPKIAWQVDTFGHSREQAFLFSQMGFDAFFFGRMDYQYKSHRRYKKELEMIWNSSPNNLGKSAWIFTGILYNYYQPPYGFCFDQLCKDDPIIDDPRLSGYNVEEKVTKFIRTATSWAAWYSSNNLLMTMGSDFHYMNANMWYKNLDKLIKYVNAYDDYGNSTRTTKINVMYSTPSCYLQEVHRNGTSLPMKFSDFFPYSNDPYGYWSGYFTSRPTFKYFVHKASSFLQICKQLSVGAYNGQPKENVLKKVFELAEPVAIVQHHDAITGTARQHVTDDYSYRLAFGMANCEEVVDEALRKLVKGSVSSLLAFPSLSASPATAEHSLQKYQFCQLTNISACTPTEEMTDFLVSVYNPLTRTALNTYIRIPVSSPYWNVQHQNGAISVQTVPIPEPVMNLSERKSKAKYEIVFKLGELPGLAVETVRVTKTASKDVKPAETSQHLNKSGDIVVENSVGVKLVLDNVSGLLKSISRGTVQLPLTQNFYYYLGMAGNNSQFKWRASGAYIFRPNTSSANNHQPMGIGDGVTSYKIYKGVHATEIHQIFNEWISQVIRLYDKSDLVEFEWLVGPIPIGDGYGKEVITKYTTDLPTNGTFFTDSNGRQFVERLRDTRDYPFWEYEKVAQNYYPVTSRILISKDQNFPNMTGPAIVILNDRSQGGTSMNDGEIELMIHRRLLFDDAFGVEEALNEKSHGTGLSARGKHWLLLCGEGTGVPISRHRQQALDIFLEKLVAFSNITTSAFNDSLLATRTTVLSALSRILPPNIHMLTLEAISKSQLLLRLEHFYERGENRVFSKPVKILVDKLMNALPFVKNVRETSLGGNQWIEKVKRFEWKPKGPDAAPETFFDESSYFDDITNGVIYIRPMEIKTFILELSP